MGEIDTRMKKLCGHPLFLTGLVIRLALIVLVVPTAATEWYVPFLDVSSAQLTLDPWGSWLEQGGTQSVFPYGYMMWLLFLPLILISKLMGIPLLYGYGLTLLAVDFGLLLLLRKLLPGRDRLLLAVYWLSPIVILATYGLGYNDLVPVLLLTLALYFTRRLQFKFAGIACLSAVSAKFSMVLALPFFLIYLFNNRSMRQMLPQFSMGLLIGATLFGLPFLASDSGLTMLFGNPEMDKVYQMVLALGGNVVIYPVPLMYLLTLYMVWRVRRLNYELFHASLGMAFLLIVLLTQASPGWFIWIMPLLVTYQAMSGRVSVVLTAVFSGLYVLNALMAVSIRFASDGQLSLEKLLPLFGPLEGHAASLLHTAMVATGIILAVRIWRESVSRNDYFRLSRKPFVLGVAGDSAAGKETFSTAITQLFGSPSVTTLSGDDYHLWDKKKPMWKVLTPLNPMANDLERYSNDLVALADGKSIHTRHYNHQTGKMSRPTRVESNDVIIASGLHALYLPILRNCYNLSVYLDIDEGLRRHFKLQSEMKRDGHKAEDILAACAKQEPDSERFIRPQAEHADLLLSLQPIHARVLSELDDERPLRLKLVARTRHGLNELSLIRVLVGVCGLHVDMTADNDTSEVVLTIEGETSADDMALAARMLCPRMMEFLDIQPKWQDGMMGLMQLITLTHIDQAQMRRII